MHYCHPNSIYTPKAKASLGSATAMLPGRHDSPMSPNRELATGDDRAERPPKAQLVLIDAHKQSFAPGVHTGQQVISRRLKGRARGSVFTETQAIREC